MPRSSLGDYFINNTNILCKWSPFMSSCLNVAHTALENKKFISQDKYMARRAAYPVPVLRFLSQVFLPHLPIRKEDGI